MRRLCGFLNEVRVINVATKPLESILYRELSMAEAKEIIELASPLMQELVNYATNVLARCATSRTLSGREDEDVAALALYRHVIELTDGIEVLLSRSCSAFFILAGKLCAQASRNVRALRSIDGKRSRFKEAL